MPRQQTDLVILTIPFLVGWGTELQTLALAKVLREQGWRVAICCCYDYDKSTLSTFREAGIELILLDMEMREGIIALIKRLRRLFRELQPAVVHVQYMIRGLAAIVAARIAGVPCVFATVHHPGRLYGLWNKLLFRISALLVTRFFCNSLAVERSWFGKSTLFEPSDMNSQGRHATIYNAVPTIERPYKEVQKRSLEIQTEHRLTGQPIIGMIGRVSREKGHMVLISALPIILREVPDAMLFLIGSGPDLPEVLQMAEDRGVLKSIIWIDRLPQTELFDYYRIMNVIVVPSFLEGFGLVAAEASAAGLPVVASDVDGLREVIDNGRTGLLVPPNHPVALAGAVVTLLKDKELAGQLGGHGRERVNALFPYKRLSESIRAVYANICR